jgi:hypothetical protein
VLAAAPAKQDPDSKFLHGLRIPEVLVHSSILGSFAG